MEDNVNISEVIRRVE